MISEDLIVLNECIPVQLFKLQFSSRTVKKAYVSPTQGLADSPRCGCRNIRPDSAAARRTSPDDVSSSSLRSVN